MTNPTAIHNHFVKLGITEATIHAPEGDYYYIAISPTEFQLGLEGNLPTNYETAAPTEVNNSGELSVAELHSSLQALEINEATIHTLEGDFYYFAAEGEFQFSKEETQPSTVAA